MLFFESMNAKVDKEKKAVYNMDGFDIQITDSVLGEGAFYCIAAVWCEDGYTGNLFDDEDGIVMREERIYLFGLVVKDVLIILFHIKKMALHIFAVSMSMQRQFHVPINI